MDRRAEGYRDAMGEPANGDRGEGRPGGNHPTTGDGNSGGFLRTASTLKCGVRSCRPKLWPSPARAALLVLPGAGDTT